MSRAIDTSIKLGETKQYIPTVGHKDLLLFVIANVFLQSAMGFNYSILNKGLHGFFKQWSMMYPNDKIQVDVWHKMLANGVKSF
jgi:hypothetical protein